MCNYIVATIKGSLQEGAIALILYCQDHVTPPVHQMVCELRSEKLWVECDSNWKNVRHVWVKALSIHNRRLPFFRRQKGAWRGWLELTPNIKLISVLHIDFIFLIVYYVCWYFLLHALQRIVLICWSTFCCN